MFLIRTAFWLTILILLLPANQEQQKEVYGTAEAAVKDFSNFCYRNPVVCLQTKTAFDTFTQKAQFGATMVMDFVKDFDGSETASADAQPTRRFSLFGSKSQNTLNQNDADPAWSGPAS
jgi:hypothetical protein